MPDHVRDDMPWEKIAEEAYRAACLETNPRSSVEPFDGLPGPVQQGWIAAVKAGVRSYMKNDIPEWQKTPVKEREKDVDAPKYTYDPDDFVGGAG